MSGSIMSHPTTPVKSHSLRLTDKGRRYLARHGRRILIEAYHDGLITLPEFEAAFAALQERCKSHSRPIKVRRYGVGMCDVCCQEACRD